MGEAVAELLAKELYIEESFKLYYIDDDADYLLVNAHTTLKELLGSECVIAELRPPRAVRTLKEKRGKPKPSAIVLTPTPTRREIAEDFD